MWNLARESRFCPLLAFLCMGLTSAAGAFDSAPSPPGQPGNSQSAKISAGEIAALVEYWPAHCGELEAEKRNTEASRCWWFAAEELNRHANGDHPLTDEIKDLRRDWLWRGARLSRVFVEPKGSAAVEPLPIPPAFPDATAAVPAAPKKKAAITKVSKKKSPEAESAKAETTPEQKARKKTIAKPAAVDATEAALPSIPERKMNFACPPSNPCIGRRLPASQRW